MSPPGTVASSWARVATGARLVASAVAQQSTSDVSTMAQRVAHHGLDLTTKARQTVASGDVSSFYPPGGRVSDNNVSSSVATAVQNSILQTAAALASTLTGATNVADVPTLSHGRRQQNDDGFVVTSSGSLYGTAPYESQLRKKVQQRQHQSNKSVNSNKHEPTSSLSTTLESIETVPNPYIFHVPRSQSSSSSSSSSSSFVGSTVPHGNDSRSLRPILNDNTVSITSAPLSSSSLSSTRTSTSTSITGPSSDAIHSDDQSPNNITNHNMNKQSIQHDNNDTSKSGGDSNDQQQQQQHQQYLREGRAVPSTRLGRAFGFATLGAGLAWGTIGGFVSSAFSSSSGGDDSSTTTTTTTSAIVNDANADRLAATLCRMRGAAMKMGQMLSIQDESLLPPALTRALKQVRQGADAMPKYQLLHQLESQLGTQWRDRFVTFDEQPFAAASIGQVHRATIEREGGTIQNVVVKVQYPGVAQSIESDLGNLAMLVKLTGLSPKGLFIDNVMRVGRDELKVECNYLNEMANHETFQTLVGSDPILQQNKFVVPDVYGDLTTDQIIATAYAPGGTIDKVTRLDQDERNRIGRTIMYLTMKELFSWRLMQTDPNWGNFLYDVATQTTSLIDFGATREYPKSFVDGYLRIVWASANQDEGTLMSQSRRMKFLTGEENDMMLNAHKLSGFTVGEPFWTNEPFDFRGSQISSRMSEHTSVFLRHRLTPPPEEVYTLHRKLAGAYMLCIKLGAVVQCRDMLEEIVSNHVFEDGIPPPIMPG